MKNQKRRRILTGILGVAVCTATVFLCPILGEAEGQKRLGLDQAQSLSVSSGKDYRRIYNRITMKEIRYESALKAAQLKEKTNHTYQWSPLLNFELPQQVSMTEEYQWQYQPVQLQSEINSLKHQLIDCQYEAEKETAFLYIQAYVCQEKIQLLQEQLKLEQENLKRNAAKAAAGTGAQSDNAEQHIEEINNNLALQMRTLQTMLEKLSEQINLDITEGYLLQNPLGELEVSREDLDKIIEYTLENHQSYYETKLAESTAYLSLTTLESLMQSKYAADMENLQIYINQAKNGEEVNEEALKTAFDTFFETIDSPWKDEQEVLSIEVTKEWFQGTSGSFYLEDDPYALFTAILEYKEALNEKETQEKELTRQVKDGYEAVITERNNYELSKKAEESLQKDITRAEELYRLGKASYEEVSQKQEEFRQSKIACLDALESYGKQLEEYNCLTCGAVEKFNNNSGEITTAIDELVETEYLEGAYYSIDYRVEDRIFVFGIQIPENFSVEITDYELYVNETKIGEKSGKAEHIKHLSLDFAQVEKAEVYLYKGEELYFVCEINPYTTRGTLEIAGGYQVTSDTVKATENKEKVASFTSKTDKDKKITTLNIKPSEDNIAYYALTIGDNYLCSEEPISIDVDYQYISLLVKELGNVTINFYDEQKELLYQGEFDTLHNCIYRKAEN